MKTGYRNAYYGCRKTGVCVIRDDMAEVLEKMHWADVIVMASPHGPRKTALCA